MSQWFGYIFKTKIIFLKMWDIFLLWEPYPSYYNGLFSPLLVQSQKSRSLSVLYEQYETSYLFYVTLSFLCNIICYLISVFAFSLVTLSGATTLSIYLHLFLCMYVYQIIHIYLSIYLLWEAYPSHHNGLFSPLLVLRDFAAREADQYRDFLPFLCNSIFLV